MTDSHIIENLIKKYDLVPHPEGGYFKETYRSSESVPKSGLPPRFSGDRSVSTAIYFLLPRGTKSHLHRIKADEMWHFYAGGPLVIVEIAPTGEIRETTLGQDEEAGQIFQHLVPAGNWFGAYPAEGSAYSLVGCTVSPGFDFQDFEMAERPRLIAEFPHATHVIESLA